MHAAQGHACGRSSQGCGGAHLGPLRLAQPAIRPSHTLTSLFRSPLLFPPHPTSTRTLLPPGPPLGRGSPALHLRLRVALAAGRPGAMACGEASAAGWCGVLGWCTWGWAGSLPATMPAASRHLEARQAGCLRSASNTDHQIKWQLRLITSLTQYCSPPCLSCHLIGCLCSASNTDHGVMTTRRHCTPGMSRSCIDTRQCTIGMDDEELLMLSVMASLGGHRS